MFFESHIFTYILVGFAAQMIDGALGMAYGVSSNTFLLCAGIPPALSSACVHLAEVLTTAVSGFSHWRFGNVDRKLVQRLLIPGVLGGVIGAYVLTSIPTQLIKPIVAGYLLIMGVVILVKLLRPAGTPARSLSTSRISILGAVGGFFDAIGGGGWGPIVTSTLVARGDDPRTTIGSVNLSEFAVTLAESISFVVLLQVIQWEIVIGLMVGGVIAAPFGAIAVKRVPARLLRGMLGLLITFLSIRTIALAVG